MSKGLHTAVKKMREAGMGASAIRSFEHAYGELEAGKTGIIPEASIDPVAAVVRAADIEASDDDAHSTLAQTAVIRLNGGLGTSMGLAKAKTLLRARADKTFLQLIVEQIMYLRQQTGSLLPLIFMNSFRTRTDCQEQLASYPDLPVSGIPQDFIQNAVPKISQETLAPVEWPAHPGLEWCPPGHGDIYTTLADSDLLPSLLERGIKYLFVANGDNLGAYPDARIAAWFAKSDAPFMIEVTKRTPADLKGGHLARRKSDGQLILREIAQTAPEDIQHFTDGSRHPYLNCNNLWLAIKPLQERLKETSGVLQLPLIRNEKTVDPTNPASPKVYQLESAMGAAVERFPGAIALEVGRDRFIPVKTTNDLLVLRSDVYDVGEDSIPRLTIPEAPIVMLNKKHFGLIADFEQRIPDVPSLREANSLKVEGDWTFAEGVRVIGDVTLADQGHPATARGVLT
ncbi:UTP--glucose-1-phosphate uridylyltransferase [Trueperella bonasi]|uniref:UTP--glucose-1-phosphate uridylyltransferase n=1 Tax=Trueperella bonasi TaxID=312286 RepID=A0ABT9NEW0_9ACTO|nr:UTP--glucose-1-phosphate uridylyltransferase [Trueperella bonasi]MDP9805926.1 UTP--glucose-1-phosphate uridylyltransferase [Trueperella bonasi]